VSKPSPSQTSLGLPTRVSRPKAIDTAFQLTIAGLVLGVIGTVVTTLADHEQVVRVVRSMLTRTGQPFTEDDVVSLIGPTRIAGGILVALAAGVVVLVAFKMRAGRNWARLLLTLFALLGMVNFLGAVTASGVALVLIWNLAGVAFWAAAVVYLFRPESMTFFTESKKRR
jgi:hypothetical protein